MTIEIKKNQEQTVIAIVGRLDTITAPALEKTINEDIGDTKNLILDVKGMEYISSAGLRILKLLYMALRKKDGELEIKNVNKLVMEVFEMTGFADILTIES